MRLLFAGTPEAAVPSLMALVASPHEVCAVLTRPDAPAGRGRRLERSPVGAWADDLGIPVWSPPSPRDPEFLDRLRNLAPECCPVVAYGGLIPAAALAVPPRGWVNLHFSLLPAWRGAAPVQHAIWHGDEFTGATTFVLDEGLDTGPVLGVMTEAIGAHDTSGDLLGRLAVSGADLLVRTMDALENDTLSAVPQPHDGISLAPKIDVQDARIRWGDPALAIDRLVRACTPAPGAWTTLRSERVKVGPVVMGVDAGLAPGEISVGRTEVRVGTGTTSVVLGDVRAEGRKSMAAADWARGLRLERGESFA